MCALIRTISPSTLSPPVDTTTAGPSSLVSTRSTLNLSLQALHNAPKVSSIGRSATSKKASTHPNCKRKDNTNGNHTTGRVRSDMT
ncbi:hypothetical protein CPB85DRAFT_1320775 [Mucidula mucida]|nr:hypothetical protein CPB85DRAFT_1320775 [Mucidula mucida]